MRGALFECKPTAFPQLFFPTVQKIVFLLIGPQYGKDLLNFAICVLAVLDYSPWNIPKRLVGLNWNLSQGRNFTISLGICFFRLKGHIGKPFPSAACLLSSLQLHELCSTCLKLLVASSCPRLP